MRRLRTLLLCTVAAAPALSASPVWAQAPAAGTGAQQAPPAAPPAPAAAAQQAIYSSEQLDQMLAPIALYPDALLSQVLMAATYPLEVIEAARWQKSNSNLKGDAAVQAAQDKAWDVSVKSLVAFPQVLQQMSDQLEWTQKLGDAMLAQQNDVAASIQRLRDLAYKSGTLKSGEQQKVTVDPAPSAAGAVPQTIIIEPSNPQTVYVPVYQPAQVYGTWPYPASPPYYYPPYPGYGYGGAFLSGFMWGAGIAATGAMFGAWNWRGGDVNINVDRAANIDRNFNRGNGGNWQHQPEHRKGVAYRDNASRQRYSPGATGSDARQQFRGKSPTQPAVGGGPAGGQRPGGPGAGGQVGAQRPGGGAGPGGGGAAGVQRPAGGAGGAVGQGGTQRPGGAAGAGGGARPGGQPAAVARPPAGGQGGALDGVGRGGQSVNRDAARGAQSVGRLPGAGGGGGGGGRGGGGRGGGGGRR